MININKKIILAFFLTFLFGFNSIAETNYPFTSIAIVDLNLILTDSKAAKNATKKNNALAVKDTTLAHNPNPSYNYYP